MRVLLDENLPHDIAASLVGHEVFTVQGLGWAGTKNGELLTRACGRVDALITMDRMLERQHDTAGLSFGIVVVRARTNRVEDIQPLVGAILKALSDVAPGQVRHVGA